MKKHMIPLTVLLSASLLCLCACGSSSAETDDKPEETAETVPEESAEPEEDVLAQPVELTFGVRGMGERYYLYDALVSPLAEKNVNLEMNGVSDTYMLFGNYDVFDGPGKLQAQDILNKNLSETNFRPIAYTFVTKYSICSASLTSLDELKAGSKIAVPMEYTRGSSITWRILEILEEAGLIKAKSKDQVQDTEPGFSKFIEENIKGVEIIDTIPSFDVRTNLSQFDAVVLDADYDNVLLEDPTAENPDYWEAIYAKADLLKDPETVKALKMLVDEYHTEKSITYIQANMPGLYPAGWDVDLLAQY